MLFRSARECREKQRQLAAAACALKVTEWKAAGVCRLLAAAEDERGALRVRLADAEAERARLRALVTVGRAEVQGIRWELGVRCEEVDGLRERLALAGDWEAQAADGVQAEARAQVEELLLPSRAVVRSPAENAEGGEDEDETDLPGIVILCPSTDALPAAEEGEDDLADSTLLTVPPRRAAASDTPGVPDRERELMDLIEFLRLDPASFVSPRDRRVSFAASTASRDSGKRVLHKRRHASMPVDGASQSRPSTKSVTSFWASFRRRNGAMPDLRYSWS